MNKKTLVIVLIITALVGVSAAYVLLTPAKDMPTPTANNQDQEARPDTPKSPPPSAAAAKGEYIDYSEAAVASAKGTKLLFFHAPWCPQCRALDESIRSSEIPDGVTIFKIDYDSNQPLRAKYGVTLQTTVVKLDDSGNKVASYVAYDDPTFQSVKQALLP